MGRPLEPPDPEVKNGAEMCEGLRRQTGDEESRGRQLHKDRHGAVGVGCVCACVCVGGEGRGGGTVKSDCEGTGFKFTGKPSSA